LLQSFADALEDQQVWEAWTQLKELFEIFVLVCFLSNSILLKHSEKVFTLDNIKCLLFSFRFNILLIDNFLAEFSCCQIVFKKEKHKHNHNFYRLLIKFR
jgi:hypothetical protein